METIQNIYCIGRNYVAHVHELGNTVPESPVVFSKPTHALAKASRNTITLPKDKGDVHFETELVLKMGKDYEPGIAVDEIVSEMTIGLDLTLRDIQSKLKEKRHPWLVSKGFPNAAIIGEFIPFPGEAACKETNFTLEINGETRQDGDVNKMIFPLEAMIQYIGDNLGLKAGDVIFTGTPEGVAPLKEADELVLKWGKQTLGACTITLK